MNEYGQDPDAGEVTLLIRRWRGGDSDAHEALFEAVYGDLRRLAASYMRDERESHTLPPTGLVNEAFLRMQREESAFKLAENRRHFFSIAARAMRRILVEHARFHAAARRPSSRQSEPIDEELLGEFGVVGEGEAPLLEILAIDQALERLRAANERQAQVVELRYFAGLEESETADILGVSRATVTRDWRIARMMLRTFIASKKG